MLAADAGLGGFEAALGSEAWDSGERRQATAQDLHARVGHAEAVEAAMRADVAQGRPAEKATRDAGSTTTAQPRRRPTVVRQRDQQWEITR